MLLIELTLLFLFADQAISGMKFVKKNKKNNVMK